MLYVTSMLTIEKDPSFIEKGIPWGYVDAQFPPEEAWRKEEFYAFARQELDALRISLADYDRKAVFGENPYVRYFKKYKKTYPVLQQLESWLLKGRPFPEFNPINSVTFLTELTTRMLLGTHDADRVEGALRLFCPEEKGSFPGMRGEAHFYPGDLTGRDDRGIVLSLIAGPDDRTCLHPDTLHVAFLFFGVPGVTGEEIAAVQKKLISYAAVLAPGVKVDTFLT